jgi:uncharacterized membrane protein
MKRVIFLSLAVTLVATVIPHLAHAEDTTQTSHEYLEKAKILEAGPSTNETEPWSGTVAKTQSVTVQVLEGDENGKTATFQNNYTQVKAGDVVYVRHTVGGFDPEMWSISDPYRLNVLIVIAIGFLVLLFIFGGVQGLRGLASLLGSLGLIFYVLIPGVYSGYSPVLVSIGVASLIIIAGSYITHGFNRTTTVAMLGMLGTVIVTGIATYLAIHYAQLSGFTTEENAYLNLGTGGRIDPIGLLYGGIMIGLLGVLYDIAIGQAVAVEELIAAGAHYTRTQVFNRSMRIGREHIGALVNTLAIAYVGASLPILLLFRDSTASVSYVLNSERFATEIIRILMGSAGLVLAVPITTLLATYVLYGRASLKNTHTSHSH